MAGTRVAVLFGGPSAEHEISIRSADSLAGWLAESGLEVVLIHLRRDATWAFASIEAGGGRTDAPASRLAAAPPGVPLHEALRRLLAEADVAFPIVHGTLGEDGALQGLLRVLGMPCAGSGLLASALAMDKAHAKSVLAATTTLRMPSSVAIARHEFEREGARIVDRLARLDLPCIVKPVDAGSSAGLARIEEPAGLPAAIAAALAVEGVTAALVEEFLEGIEVTCAVVGDPGQAIETLPPILIRPAHGGLFDWQAKYTPGGSEELCPAPLPEPECDRIREAAGTAYRALGCRGFARVDFILREGTPWFLELNTLPGLTRESLFPKAARAAGRSLPALFRSIVERAQVAVPPQARARAAT